MRAMPSPKSQKIKWKIRDVKLVTNIIGIEGCIECKVSICIAGIQFYT